LGVKRPTRCKKQRGDQPERKQAPPQKGHFTSQSQALQPVPGRARASPSIAGAGSRRSRSGGKRNPKRVKASAARVSPEVCQRFYALPSNTKRNAHHICCKYPHRHRFEAEEQWKQRSPQVGPAGRKQAWQAESRRGRSHPINWRDGLSQSPRFVQRVYR
jgi:hypothetical protein